jgi:hypothetical protein
MSVSSQPRKDGARRRLTIVSGYGNDDLTPRGQRTRRLIDALDGDWDVELIAMREKPSSAQPGGTSPRRAAFRRLVGRLLYRVLLDRWEPWSWRRLRRWRPDADAALLIASPWSPVVYASRRLVKAGIPYVVDVGDPWALTNEDPESTAPPPRRALRAERVLWENAAGGVVTTRAQFELLHALFPDLPMTIRPNGYKPVESRAEVRPPGGRDDSCLRLAHFGILSANRIDPVPFLAALWESGRWESIVFSQFGDDFGVGLDRVPDGVRVEHHAPRPWEEVIERCRREFDAVLAVAYPLPALVPSKAIEYLTLPLPRIALTNPDPGDALREFVETHPGWLAVSNGEAEIGTRVRRHLECDWSPAELEPPAEDAWPAVAARIAEFVTECVSSAHTRGIGPTALITSPCR